MSGITINQGTQIFGDIGKTHNTRKWATKPFRVSCECGNTSLHTAEFYKTDKKLRVKKTKKSGA